MALTSSSHASSYHVFLSFRGKETRLGFTGNLYNALTNKGIRTYIDDEELQSGEEIAPALVKAIKESRIAIIVLSKDYASSSFCLDELATIIDCKSKGMLVIPVFYEVDPCDVRHHKGSYGESLTKHEERFQHNPEKLQKWKMALHQVANLSGYHFRKGDVYEYKFTESIVDRVLVEINHPARLSVPDHLVGLESKKTEIMKLLDVGSNDGVHMVGIHGMGGIGKSTLARAIYNDLIAEKFDGSCYLENVREKSNKHGLEHLQRLLLQKILGGDKNINLTSVEEGASMIEDRLRQKKVLLVLDDVDNTKQLEAIVGRPDWYGPGSRVIITTRDKHLLKSHDVERTYKVEALKKNDALQLLTRKAFKNGNVDPTYEEVLNCVLAYASGLPLALEVMGAHLKGKSIEEWESAINQYKRIPHNGIHGILKVSFDALQDEEKSVFLDITCCLKGLKLTEVEDILSAHYDGRNLKHHIGVLVEKSLIKFDFTMHDLIEDMGKEIVRQESLKEPGKRSRLWSPQDVINVLEDDTGTKEIEMICVDFSILEEDIIEWDGNAFKNMSNLKTLIIRHGVFSEGPKILPKNLRVLEWWGYPSNSLPCNFQPKELAICKLPHSRLTSLELGGSSKKFMNLTALNFDKCEHLTRICDISSCPNLEKLSFKGCRNLVAVHESIGFLDRLQVLNAYGCSKLESFPPIHLTSLRELQFSDCSSLESFPEILGKMENIRELYLWETPIKKWPMSFQYLIGLHKLDLSDCEIGQLPSSIAMMPRLKEFLAGGCEWGQLVEQEEDEGNVGSKVSSKLTWLCVPRCNLNDDFFRIGFTHFDHMKYLDLSGNNFTILPECIKEFQSLRYLDVSNCKHLQEIKGVPPNLEEFYAQNCKSLSSLSTSMLIQQELYKAESGMSQCCLPGACVPEWFDQKSRGPSTSFWVRNNFPNKVLSLLIAPGCDFSSLMTYPDLFINGKYQKNGHWPYKGSKMMEMDHNTYIFELNDLYPLMDGKFEVPLKNEWNHVLVDYGHWMLTKASGIHLFKKESNNEEDIRFTNPDCDLNSSQSQIQPLLKKRRFAMPILKFHRYNLCVNGKKKKKNESEKEKRIKKNDVTSLCFSLSIHFLFCSIYHVYINFVLLSTYECYQNLA